MAQSPDVRLVTETKLAETVGGIPAQITALQDQGAAHTNELSLHEGRIEDLEVLGGLTPGDVNDVTMKTLAADPESQFRTELNAAIVEGAKGTGYDGILVIGQSNPSGRGIPTNAALDPPHPLIFQLKGKNPDKGTVIAASEPLDMVDTPSGIGPSVQFARHYIKAGHLSYGRKVLLIPCAEGGTPLTRVTPPTWNPSVSGSLADNAVNQVTTAMALPGFRLVAIIWGQGETDGDLAATGADYQAKQDALIDKIRALPGASDVPFIIGGMVPEYLGTGTRAAINSVQADTPNRKTRTAFVAGPAGGELGDGNHYNRQGQITLAAAMFDAYTKTATGIPGTSLRTYTTDAFGTASTTLAGRTTDPANGGYAVAWSANNANAAFATSGGSLVRGASVTSQFGQITVPNSRQRISVKVAALPVGGGQIYVTARMDGVNAQNGYRLVIFDTGNVQLQKVVAGTGTNLVATYSAAVTAGATIALDCDGTNLTVSVNGTPLGSAVVDSTFARAGWAGLGIGSTVTTFALKDWKIESVF